MISLPPLLDSSGFVSGRHGKRPLFPTRLQASKDRIVFSVDLQGDALESSGYTSRDLLKDANKSRSTRVCSIVAVRPEELLTLCLPAEMD